MLLALTPGHSTVALPSKRRRRPSRECCPDEIPGPPAPGMPKIGGLERHLERSALLNRRMNARPLPGTAGLPLPTADE